MEFLVVAVIAVMALGAFGFIRIIYKASLDKELTKTDEVLKPFVSTAMIVTAVGGFILVIILWGMFWGAPEPY